MTYRAEFHMFDGSTTILETGITESQLAKVQARKELFEQMTAGLGTVEIVPE